EEYTEIAQKSVFAAVESWKNGSLDVTEIEGYKVDPVDTESEKLAGAEISVNFASDVDSLKERIAEAVLAILPEDFNVDSVTLAEDFEITGEGQKFTAAVKIRFGYMSKEAEINVTIGEAICGDINLDGSVDVKDAYYARLVAAKLIRPTEQQILLGDVDLDGRITALDANIIRKFAVKIITEIPVKK
ncbi:MAG: dockerin type I repeat-containing protein, partial [Oscillospiraceae bacterium]|nr:dockerin type I repeat-containing protein [Oscillospiraceae bacterium]